MFLSVKLKKIIICVFVLAAVFSFSGMFISKELEPTDVNDSIQVPIIMYHEIKTFKTGRDVITPEEFEGDLKYLKDNGYNTITMTELINYVYEDQTLPSKPIILSFDDGYLNNYKYAMPLLEKYDMKIVMSIIGKDTENFSRVNETNIDYAHVTWDQVNEMSDSGFVEIQNHTYNMHGLTKRIGCVQMRSETFDKYEQLLSEDLNKLQEQIYECTGLMPNTFTYPYGRYNDRTESIIKKLGFKATLTCDYGINIIGKAPDDLYGLKRIGRAHGTTVEKLLAQAQKTIRK